MPMYSVRRLTAPTSTVSTTPVTRTQMSATGMRYFQPIAMSRSKRSRGSVARSQTNRKMKT